MALALTMNSAAARGQLQDFIEDERKKIVRAGAVATGRVADQIKTAARNQVNAKLGRRRKVGNTIRAVKYPEDSAALVFSKLGRTEDGQFVDYLVAHEQGKIITPRRGRWLFIPDPSIRGRRRSVRFSAKLDKRIRFIPIVPGQIMRVVRQTRRRTTLLGMLVKRVRIRKKLDFQSIINSADDELARQWLDAVGD